jgi:hypothetical protein
MISAYIFLLILSFGVGFEVLLWHYIPEDMTHYFITFFPCGSTAQFWALAASIKLSVSFQLLDLGQSAGLLGRVISSSQGFCVSAPRVMIHIIFMLRW